MRTLVWFGLLCLVVPSAVGQQRGYRIDDFFSTEEVVTSSVTVSPDGQSVAFMKRRAAKTQLANGLATWQSTGDIWLQEASGQPARNLTQGQADSSGWWRPQWSPDGNWLAMLSSRGGEVRLWGWERRRKQLKLLAPGGLDVGDYGGCHWVDARRLLCSMLPEGERATPSSDLYGKPLERAEAGWAKAKRGEATASAVHSLRFRLPTRRLVVVDVGSGKSHVAATTQLLTSQLPPANWWLSPTAQTVAFVLPEPAPYSLPHRVATGFPASIGLASLDGQPVRLNRPLPTNVVTSSLQWSPDGQELAFFALSKAPVHAELIYGEAAREVRYPVVSSKEYPGQLWRVDMRKGVVEQLKTGDIDLGQGPTPPAFQWTAKGELLFRAPRLVRGMRPLTPVEPSWVVLGREGRMRELATGGQQLPTALEAIDGRAAFLGVLDGEVWRVDATNGKHTNLTARFGPRVETVSPVTDAKSSRRLLVSTLGRQPQSAWEQFMADGWNHWEFLYDYSLLDVTSGAVIPLQRPGPNAMLVHYDGLSRSAFWHAADRAGTFLWRQARTSRRDTLVATNTFWKDVVRGEQRSLNYVTLNGEAMQAVVVLPIGYRPDRRYPLVVDFDIGSTSKTSGALVMTDSSSVPHVTGEAFAAAGYAYLYASWPSTSMDQIGRGNMLLGPNGILPAVEKAIAEGIADPGRLFLFGASSAGYGVFALVTQTSRFKAAAAHAGWVDQMTARLGENIHDRYTENPFDNAFMGAGYISSRLPFWRNGELYRRNSPLAYVDRVQTPLLILHGELDLVELTQPEMFFNALVVQRKPAQFVRYWGEGHSNDIPANLRDYFQRIFAWYDEWGDIARDEKGNTLFEGDRVKSRQGAPALPPEAYAKLSLFGTGATSRPAEATSVEVSAQHQSWPLSRDETALSSYRRDMTGRAVVWSKDR